MNLNNKRIDTASQENIFIEIVDDIDCIGYTLKSFVVCAEEIPLSDVIPIKDFCIVDSKNNECSVQTIFQLHGCVVALDSLQKENATKYRPSYESKASVYLRNQESMSLQTLNFTASRYFTLFNFEEQNLKDYIQDKIFYSSFYFYLIGSTVHAFIFIKENNLYLITGDIYYPNFITKELFYPCGKDGEMIIDKNSSDLIFRS